MDAHQGFAELVVAEFVERVEIRSDGSGKENGVLGNNCESSTKIVKLDFGDIDVVDCDAAFAGLEEAEEGER